MRIVASAVAEGAVAVVEVARWVAEAAPVEHRVAVAASVVVSTAEAAAFARARCASARIVELDA